MSTAPDAAALPILDSSSAGLCLREPGLTAREHAAIALRVPDSGNDWLDAMIRMAQRNELAKEAMAAIVSGITASRGVIEDKHLRGLSVAAGQIAAAMLSASAAHSAEGE